MTDDPEYFSGTCPTCGQPYLRAQNAKLIEALEKIIDLAHYPDESIARAAIVRARGEK